MNHRTMLKQHYDDIPRYTKRVYGDRFPHVEMNIPIKIMLMPMNKNIIEIDTKNTTQIDGEYNFLGVKNTWKIIELDVNVKIKLDSFNLAYGVNGGRRFYKFHIEWLKKQTKASIGDIVTIIRVNDKVHVLDVNIKSINKLKQIVW